MRIPRPLAAVCYLFTVLSSSTVSHASTSSGGTIYGISVEQGRAFFYVTGPRTTPPACSTVPGRWVFDASTAQGQAMMAGLMTFYSQGKQIAVGGTNSCPTWPDTETVQYIWQTP